MSAHITLAELNAWQGPTKTQFELVPVELESAASEYILSQVARVYDTTAWIDATTTPDLIRKMIAMQVAAWSYLVTYSEVDVEVQTYSQMLTALVGDMMVGVLSGLVDLRDVPGEEGDPTGPTFTPDASTGLQWQADASGALVGADMFSEDIKFRMGDRF